MEDDMRLAEVAVLRQVEVACAQPLTFLHQLVGCQIKLDIMTTGRLEWREGTDTKSKKIKIIIV